MRPISTSCMAADFLARDSRHEIVEVAESWHMVAGRTGYYDDLAAFGLGCLEFSLRAAGCAAVFGHYYSDAELADVLAVGFHRKWASSGDDPLGRDAGTLAGDMG